MRVFFMLESKQQACFAAPLVLPESQNLRIVSSLKMPNKPYWLHFAPVNGAIPSTIRIAPQSLSNDLWKSLKRILKNAGKIGIFRNYPLMQKRQAVTLRSSLALSSVSMHGRAAWG